MKISSATIDAVMLLVVEVANSAKKPSVKEIRSSVEDILCPNYPDRDGGYGRASLRKYIVARCYIQPAKDFARGRPLPGDLANHPHVNGNPISINDGWDNGQPEIIEARRRYDAGTHDLMQTRDGDWLIMYSIPRRRPPPFHAPHFSAVPSRSHV